MKFINRFFITLFALSLSTTIVSFCLAGTLLNADYVTTQADKSGIYTDLSKSLPKQLAGSSDSAAGLQSALERTLTPTFLQENLDAYIHNLFTAYQTNASIPPLDLTAVIPQVQALGVPLSAAEKTQLQQSLTIQPGSAPTTTPTNDQTQPTSTKQPNVSKIYRTAANSKWLLIIPTLILGILVFLTAPHHRLKALGHGCISAAIWLIILFGFFKLAPSLAAHQIQSANHLSLGSSVSNLITLAAGGVAKRLLYAAIATAAAGLVLIVASMFVPHFGTGGSDDHRTPLPTQFHKD